MKLHTDMPGRTRTGRSVIAFVTTALLTSAVTGCTAQPTITGVWAASDGSPTKTINDDGSCTGMYYDHGRVLDIGGPESCHLSQGQTNGLYDLVVQQPPNQETLQVKLDGDTMTVYSGGTVVTALTRQ
ncbi:MULTISPECIES: hypothetical protein [unclassified Leifsonia]|uniref:hypothetical protein n=1 Tax=unclassified Leifsonia TaxID=2663824 RepID=UPI0008A7EA1B|nr:MULTISPECIES: hypothetical protein [unclassified Leifsonia]SEI09984.1 hypothetical protein SAMN04515694_11539 [Leifsonia sp. CL154]SFL86942.1 hypothetical protein SAMN04515692_11569 [Leifsonia sp. CL147]